MAEPANTPIPASTPRSASPLHHGIMSPISPTKLSTLSGAPRPRVLLIGAARQSPDYVALAARCEVITASSSRDELLEGLRTRKWSQVDAVLCTAAGLQWDEELVAALPPGLRLVAVQGDFDEKLFKERGEYETE